MTVILFDSTIVPEIHLLGMMPKRVLEENLGDKNNKSALVSYHIKLKWLV